MKLCRQLVIESNSFAKACKLRSVRGNEARTDLVVKFRPLTSIGRGVGGALQIYPVPISWESAMPKSLSHLTAERRQI